VIGEDIALVLANAMSGELAFDNRNMVDRNDLFLWYKGNELVSSPSPVCGRGMLI
jgi:hypothetical protein